MSNPVERAWQKKCRLTGRNRKITCRMYDQVGMNRWLREMEVKAVIKDSERDDRKPNRNAA